MLVAVMRSGCGYHFSKKFESAALWSGVTPTSTIDVPGVGAIWSMKAGRTSCVRAMLKWVITPRQRCWLLV